MDYFSMDVEMESANLDTFQKEEFTEMIFDSKVKSTYTFKGSEYYWIKKICKISQILCNCWAHFLIFSKFVSSGNWV